MRVLLAIAIFIGFSSSVSGQGFVEVGTLRGISVVTQGAGSWGYGLGLDDLDGDGDPDLICTGDGPFGVVQVYENDGAGFFTSRTMGSGLPVSTELSGIALADYDADGDLDVFISAHEEANFLMRNDGDFVFTDVTAAAGMGDEGATAGATWGDFDGDGWVDLYVCNYGDAAAATAIDDHPNLLYRNKGDGTFENVAALHGVDDGRTGFQAFFFDPDLDGDLDLYLSNDKGNYDPAYSNELWFNENGTFVDGNSSGAEISIGSMGTDFGDLDRDGLPDIYCTNVAPVGNVLLGGTGIGDTFTDISAQAGVSAVGGVGWGCLFFDFDNDGWEELLALFDLSDNFLFDCDGTYPCTDVAPAVGLDDTLYFPWSADSYCAATADIDGDGDLDLVVQHQSELISLYENTLDGAQFWLRLDLQGESPNLDAIGALVRVESASGIQWRQVKAGSGFKSSSEMILHFGLAMDPVADKVSIRWPNGELTILNDVDRNQVLVVNQTQSVTWANCNGNFIPDADEIAIDPSIDADGDGIIDECADPPPVLFRRADANSDGSLDVADAVTILSYLFTAGSVGCTVALDVTDDESVNVADAVSLLSHIFSGGPQPVEPWPSCGEDPTAGPLDCALPPRCL